MLIKKVKYTDYNGVERTEEIRFHLSKAELMEMELGTTGGLSSMLKKIVRLKDSPSLMKIFKDMILKSYGEISPDGRRFIKIDENGNKLSTAFMQTEAYSEIFMELISSDEAAAAFVKGIMPSDMEVDEAELDRAMKELT